MHDVTILKIKITNEDTFYWPEQGREEDQPRDYIPRSMVIHLN